MFQMTKFVWNRTIQVNLSCNPSSEKTFCESKTALENNINEKTNTALKLTKGINFYWIFLLFSFLKLIVEKLFTRKDENKGKFSPMKAHGNRKISVFIK